jgi:hypothetical protein
MAKTPRKPVKQKATKPARSASAAGNKKLSPRKSAKPVKGAKKAPARKAAPKKAAPKKAVKKVAPKKAAPKKVAPRKAAPKKSAPKKAVKAPAKAAKAAPAKKAAPPKKAPAPAPAKKAAVKAAKPEAPPKPAKPAKPEPAPKEAKVGRPPRQAKPEPVEAVAPPEVDGEIVDLADDFNLDALLGEADAPPVLKPGALSGLMGAPKKRGRKRRDPLDDLLKPEKKKRGRPGRPRKRGSLAELMPKRGRLKRRKGRRSEDDDADIPVTPRPPAPRDSMPLEQIRADVLARYLLGETPACPVGCGGMAQVVRVSTGENGAGEVWLECLSCAQRERFEVPAPGTEERNKVYATLDAGNEPQCTRHNGRYVPLRRRGRDLVCPECGILIPGR